MKYLLQCVPQPIKKKYSEGGKKMEGKTLLMIIHYFTRILHNESRVSQESTEPLLHSLALGII